MAYSNEAEKKTLLVSSMSNTNLVCVINSNEIHIISNPHNMGFYNHHFKNNIIKSLKALAKFNAYAVAARESEVRAQVVGEGKRSEFIVGKRAQEKDSKN